MINKQFKCKGKIPSLSSQSLKQIFCKFEGQIDPEGQGKDYQFLKIPDLKMINTQLKLEVRTPNSSKVVTFTRNHTDF